MKVIDKIKEQKDRISDSQGELIEQLFPQIKDYWNDLWQSARNSQWVNWAVDEKDDFGDDKESGVSFLESTDTVCENPQAELVRQQLVKTLGEVIYVGDWAEVDQERINGFADVTEDNQWIHVDEERAKNESAFKSTIAHGFLTLSMLPKLTGVVDSEEGPYPGCKMVVNLGLNQVRFPSPLKAGTRIRATKKVTSIEIVKRGLIVEEDVVVEIENSKRPACIARPVYRLVF